MSTDKGPSAQDAGQRVATDNHASRVDSARLMASTEGRPRDTGLGPPAKGVGMRADHIQDGPDHTSDFAMELNGRATVWLNGQKHSSVDFGERLDARIELPRPPSGRDSWHLILQTQFDNRIDRGLLRSDDQEINGVNHDVTVFRDGSYRVDASREYSLRESSNRAVIGTRTEGGADQHGVWARVHATTHTTPTRITTADQFRAGGSGAVVHGEAEHTRTVEYQNPEPALASREFRLYITNPQRPADDHPQPPPANHPGTSSATAHAAAEGGSTNASGGDATGGSVQVHGPTVITGGDGSRPPAVCPPSPVYNFYGRFPGIIQTGDRSVATIRSRSGPRVSFVGDNNQVNAANRGTSSASNRENVEPEPTRGPGLVPERER